MTTDAIRIELACATGSQQELLEMLVSPDKTVGQIIDESGIYELFPSQGLESAAVGIWGRPVDRDQSVRDGDRIEIYRPLQMDPREARRRLAESGRTMNQKSDD